MKGLAFSEGPEDTGGWRHSGTAGRPGLEAQGVGQVSRDAEGGERPGPGQKMGLLEKLCALKRPRRHDSG